MCLEARAPLVMKALCNVYRQYASVTGQVSALAYPHRYVPGGAESVIFTEAPAGVLVRG